MYLLLEEFRPCVRNLKMYHFTLLALQDRQITLLQIFIYGIFKQEVHKTNPNNKDGLKASISAGIVVISRNTLNGLFRACTKKDGRHLKQIT